MSEPSLVLTEFATLQKYYRHLRFEALLFSSEAGPYSFLPNPEKFMISFPTDHPARVNSKEFWKDELGLNPRFRFRPHKIDFTMMFIPLGLDKRASMLIEIPKALEKIPGGIAKKINKDMQRVAEKRLLLLFRLYFGW